MTDETKKTPLHDCHTALGARMAPFGGWDMPIQYEGIIPEHHHTREQSSVFDICHMGEFELTGSSAEADLERLLTLRIGTLRDGQCRYGYLLNAEGGILDDLTCYRFGPERFWLVVNAGTCEGDAEWIRSHLSGQTTFTDLSPTIAKLDVQGPTSREDLEAVLGVPLPDLRYFHFCEADILGTPGVISRTGYTGEWGYELYFDAAGAKKVWEALLAGGRIRPAGLGARDTLRLEVGYPLYGHELGTDRSPVAASQGAFVDADKEFIGRDRVLHDLEQGLDRYLAGIELDTKRAARAGQELMHGGRSVGTVTSGSLAPSLDKAVAMAYLDKDLCEPGTDITVDMRGKELPATVTTMPFYKHGTARKK